MLFLVLTRLPINLSSVAVRKRFYVSRIRYSKSFARAPAVENDHMHETLVGIQGYCGHVLPQPRSFFEPINSVTNISHLENDKTVTLWRLLDKQYAKEPVSEPSCNIDIKESFQNQDLSNIVFKLQNNYRSSKRKGVTEIYYHYFQHILAGKSGANVSKLNHALSINIKFTSDLVLMQIMIYMCLCPTEKLACSSDLLALLDKECCKRKHNWPIEKQLLVSDIFYYLNVSKTSAYTTSLIESMGGALDDLTMPQLIHLLFIINLKRKASTELMRNIELKLNDIVNYLTIDEIAVFSMAYFKTSTAIRNLALIKKVIDSLYNAIPDISDISLVCILKVLRYSFSYENCSLIEKLLRRCVEHRIWRENVTTITHLCLLAHSHNVYVAEVLDTLIDEFMKFKQIRLKDLARISLVFNKFSHLDPSRKPGVFAFFRKELQDPKRKQEITEFPEEYFHTVFYLTFPGVFLDQEINQILHPEFYQSLRRPQVSVQRELASLDCFLEIDEPMYTGYRLDKQKRFNMLNKWRLYYPTKSEIRPYREALMYFYQEELKNILKQDVPMVHVLPYMSDPVFLLIFDRSGKLHNPPSDFMNLTSTGQVVRPTDERNWVVLWPITKKELCDVGSERLTGLSVVKERHFLKLGYKVIKLPLDVHYQEPKTEIFLLESLRPFTGRFSCHVASS